MFACNHDDVTPDILVLGKGLTSGYLPLSATITTEKIFDAFLGEVDELKAFYHGHSYSGNPLACATGIANLEIFEEDKTPFTNCILKLTNLLILIKPLSKM